VKAKEKAVRDAAAALSTAIVEAREAGLVVTWPKRAEDLPFIAISETDKANVSTQIVVEAKGVEPGSPAAATATVEAQKAVDKAVVTEPPAAKK
jgi:hypothetical protein